MQTKGRKSGQKRIGKGRYLWLICPSKTGKDVRGIQQRKGNKTRGRQEKK